MSEPSLAERLGFAAADRVLVVHADDIGMCHAANEGAFEALLGDGPASCGSVMVPCPWFAEAATLARANPECDLGVHLTLNSEWEHYRWGPVAGRAAVPSLLDDHGFLPRTTAEVWQRARSDEVETELRAQIQTALDAGIDVTHLDSHMGTLFYPGLLEVYAALADEFQLPVFAVRPEPAVLEAVGLAAAEPVFRVLVDQLAERGIPILDGFCAQSLHFAEGEGAAHNRGRVDGLSAGVSYLICHPARDGEELRAVTPDSAHQRDFERQFYGGAPGSRMLRDTDCKTVGMRPLRDLMRAGRPA